MKGHLHFFKLTCYNKNRQFATKEKRRNEDEAVEKKCLQLCRCRACSVWVALACLGCRTCWRAWETVFTASAYVINSYDGTYGDLCYSVTDTDEVKISGCNETVESVEIPARIDGKRVTSIAKNAFYGCSDLTAITIPDSVTSFEGNAFSNLENLTAITIPDSVTSIGESAFSGCTSLTKIAIPNSVTDIGGFVFSNCTNLESITLSDHLTSVGGYTFSGLHQFVCNYHTGQRNEHWTSCLFWLYQFDRDHDSKQCDKHGGNHFFRLYKFG